MRNRVAELWPGLNAEDRMRITVIGTGGIGGPYGASLATAGADVIFVARGAHLAAICENGLRIEGDRSETHIRPAQATDDIASIGIVNYVLLAAARASDPGKRLHLRGAEAIRQQSSDLAWIIHVRDRECGLATAPWRGYSWRR
jgi:hypothetical protein